MFRSSSRLIRRRLASTILALSFAPGCGYVHQFMTWRNRAAEVEALEARFEASVDGGVLQARSDRLREARARAWEGVANGGGAGDYSSDNALALSTATRALDAQTSWDHMPAAGRATLAELPRSMWWYVFTRPNAWPRGPLATDRTRMPGHYAAMMDAMEHVIATAKVGAPALTTEGYFELHRIATLGVFDRERRAPLAPGYTQQPKRYPIAALHDVGSLHVEHLARALSELKAEGVAGWNADEQRDGNSADPPAWLAKILGAHEDVNPHSKPVRLAYRRAQGARSFEEWLVGSNAYEPREAERWAAQWLDEYAAEMQKVPRRTPNEYLDLLGSQAPMDDFTMALRPGARPGEELATAVRPVARLVRRMQVSQVFRDHAQVVDTMLLLNYLLAAHGLPPSIVEDPSMFGGREPIDELTAEIVKGQQRFQVLVRELVARENVKPAAAPAATVPAPQAAT